MKNETLRIEHRRLPPGGNNYYPDIYLNVFEGEAVGVLFDDMRDCFAFLSIFERNVPPPEYLIEIREERARTQNFRALVLQNVALIGTQSPLLPGLSIAENIFLFDSNVTSIFIHTPTYQKMLAELFEFFNINIPIDQPAQSLSFFDIIRVDMLRAFVQKKRVIILSGISNLLSEVESVQIHSLINQLRGLGFSFLLVGSSGQEIFSYSTRYITISRRKMVASIDEVPPGAGAIAQNPGHSAGENRFRADGAAPVLSFHRVRTSVLAPVSFDLYPGEILLTYGEEICAHEFVSLLKRTIQPESGKIIFDKDVRRRDSLLQNKGSRYLSFVNEDPTHTTLVPSMTLLDNLCLGISLKTCTPLLTRNQKQSAVRALSGIIDEEYFDRPVQGIPLPDQYKAVYCKWLLFGPKILVCIHPFASADEKIRDVTNRMLSLLTERGCAVILIVSNPQQLTLQSRVIRLLHNRNPGSSGS